MIRDDAGFTLLEALIALAILGGALTAVFTAFAQTGQAQSRADARLRLGMAADALLERVGLDIPLRDGRITGEIGDMRWTLLIRGPQDAPAAGQLALYGVRAAVSAAGERVVVTTIRYGASAP